MSSLDVTFGISPGAIDRLKNLFDATPNLAGVWIFGSRAQGTPRLSSEPGSANGQVMRLADDFDAPLADFTVHSR